jgi:[protein-PII] uridylyltransferase
MSGLRDHILAAKRRLAEGREKLKQRHQKGSPGIQVCRAQTELFDSLVLELFEAALRDIGEEGEAGLRSQLALVPHGGYGRGDVAPFSDVDLMILHTPEAAKQIAPLAERMVRDVFDIGLVLGQSVRTPQQACQLARQDATICTSLIESRFLAGSQDLFNRYTRSFQRQLLHRANSLLSAIDEARAEERSQYGETVYLLEPNVKRSPGGLRDIQLLRWTGAARLGFAEPDALRLQGALTYADFDAISQATEFLLHLRNELHFAANKSNDVLDRAEQLRIATQFGYTGTEGLLAVEQFMREYFRHTSGVSNVVKRFMAGSRPGSRWKKLLAPLVSHQFEGDFRIEPNQITANKHGVAKLEHDLAEVFRLADVANLYDKPIAYATCEAIRAAVPKLSDDISQETAKRFISLLNQPARLSELLHSLHEMGALEKVIPEFRHARNLLQFNVYHKYTVDEHCLRAVDEATRFQNDKGPVGSVYQHLKRKWLLHLALLLHDLGKGHVQDHSEVGLLIAEETARRLRLTERDTEILKFLVHKHLVMSHLAFRRDTSDNQLVVNFAVEVGSPEVLEMLFVMTAADLAAVGPGVLNRWKEEVLADLFHRAMLHLGGDDPTLEIDARLQKRREEVLARLGARDDLHWFGKQLISLPGAYLLATASEKIARELEDLRKLGANEAIAVGSYQPESNTVEYTVGTYEDIAPGVFHKLTGALTGQGLQILSAEIHTLADGLVFDRFRVTDPDFASDPPDERLEAVSRALVTALHNKDGKTPTFRRVWRPAEQRNQSLSTLPTQVRVDNSTSDRFTILDIFAADRMGLLYTITHTLFQLGLSVSVAKIGTYLDQVVDVFYVTDQAGRKIDQEQRLAEIRRRLLDEIASFEKQDAMTAKAH